MNNRRVIRDGFSTENRLYEAAAARVAARYHTATVGGARPETSKGKSSIQFYWTGHSARRVSIVGSFDNFMHHRMLRIALGGNKGQDLFEFTLRVPPGSHTFKYLVDGAWGIDRTSPYPVGRSEDGLLHHRLVICEESVIDQATNVTSSSPALRGVPFVRSTSVMDLNPVSSEALDGRDSGLGRSRASGLSGATASPVPEKYRVNMPWSFGSRKSLMNRFSTGLSRRVSARLNSATRERDELQSQEKSSLTANIPVVRVLPDRHPRLQRFSRRSKSVSVSLPTRIDEPMSSAEVHKDAEEWRGMAW